ncbi:unnamed protein product [Caenorhabditis brenneri]
MSRHLRNSATTIRKPGKKLKSKYRKYHGFNEVQPLNWKPILVFIIAVILMYTVLIHIGSKSKNTADK